MVMLGLAEWNAEIADCWKLVWNVEPAALMVPLTELALALVEAPEPGVVVVPLEVVVEPEEEHAARARAAATTPAVASCRLRRRCISGLLLTGSIGSSAATSSPECRSACKPWCPSTVCRRSQYLRANVKWTKGD